MRASQAARVRVDWFLAPDDYTATMDRPHTAGKSVAVKIRFAAFSWTPAAAEPGGSAREAGHGWVLARGFGGGWPLRLGFATAAVRLGYGVVALGRSRHGPRRQAKSET